MYKTFWGLSIKEVCRNLCVCMRACVRAFSCLIFETPTNCRTKKKPDRQTDGHRDENQTCVCGRQCVSVCVELCLREKATARPPQGGNEKGNRVIKQVGQTDRKTFLRPNRRRRTNRLSASWENLEALPPTSGSETITRGRHRGNKMKDGNTHFSIFSSKKTELTWL